MMRASIDIGSNSVLLLIADIAEDGTLKEVANESRVTALGKGLSSSGNFAEASMKETYLVLKEYVHLASDLDIEADQIVVTATEASRVAKNAQEFYERVTSKLGIKVSIISGEGEAYYTALGVCRMAKSEDEISIVDIGGASTEIMRVRARPFKVLQSLSLPIGSVRASDWMSEGKLVTELRTAWAGTGAEELACDNAIFVAGTMTSIGAMVLGMTTFDGGKLDGQKIEYSKLCEFVEKISELDNEKLLEHYPFLGKRAASIIGGAEVALFIGDRLGLKEVQISPYGLRYGTVLEGKLEERYVQRCYG